MSEKRRENTHGRCKYSQKSRCMIFSRVEGGNIEEGDIIQGCVLQQWMQFAINPLESGLWKHNSQGRMKFHFI